MHGAVILPDSLYESDYQVKRRPFNWRYESPRRQIPSPTEPCLKRRALGRDPGFWKKFISPGGRKHIKRKRRELQNKSEMSPVQASERSPTQTAEMSPTQTSPTLSNVSTPTNPPRIPALEENKENSCFDFSPKNFLTSFHEDFNTPRKNFFRTKSAVRRQCVKRQLETSQGSSRSGGSSPLYSNLTPKHKSCHSPSWWERISPRFSRNLQLSPWSEGTHYQWVCISNYISARLY